MTWRAPSALTRCWLAGPAVAMIWAPRNAPRATSKPPVTPPAPWIRSCSPAPPGITATLKSSAHPGDHLFAPQPWGSWIEFATPDLPVAVDSRIELFPGPVWADYDSVVSGQGDWQGVLTRWDVAFVVVAAHDAAFEGRLAAAGWTSIYTGDDGSVFSAPGS